MELWFIHCFVTFVAFFPSVTAGNIVYCIKKRGTKNKEIKW